MSAPGIPLSREEAEVVRRKIETLLRAGHSREAACRIVWGAVVRWKGPRRPRIARAASGMGQDEGAFASMKAAGEAAPVKAVREAISPWLWVLSIASFVKNFFFK